LQIGLLVLPINYRRSIAYSNIMEHKLKAGARGKDVVNIP